jgi:crotonobetaine/carnitine-CoA ligase
MTTTTTYDVVNQENGGLMSQAVVPREWLAGRQETITDVLMSVSRTAPADLFIRMPDAEITYADFLIRVKRWAGALKGLGVKPGDTVVALQGNSIETLVGWFSVNWLGAVWVPVNTANKGEFLRHIIADAGASLMLLDDQYVERVVPLLNSLPELTTLVTSSAADVPDTHRSVLFDLLDSGEPIEQPHPVKPSDLAMLIYTGGTTGPSKGCMLSHNYVCNNARRWLEQTARTKDEVAWTALPLFHLNAVACSVMTTAMLGSTLYLVPKFSVSKFWDQIEVSGARVATLLGAMVTLVANAPDTPAGQRCKGQLRVIRGAPFPPKVQERWRERFGGEIYGSNAYGLTECTYTTSTRADEVPPPGAAGHRNEDFDVRVVDDEGFEVPVGEVGELIVRPLRPNVMFSGYWRRAEATLDVMKDLWFHTGDLGRFDEDGYYYFVDRKKDYMRRRGENISSAEVENAFLLHPDVREAAACAIPSEFTEDEVKITLVLQEGSTLTEEEICVWSMDQMPYFAVPRFVEFRKELPKTPVGRVQKFKLRDEGVTPATWDREAAGVEVKR